MDSVAVFTLLSQSRAEAQQWLWFADSDGTNASTFLLYEAKPFAGVRDLISPALTVFPPGHRRWHFHDQLSNT